MLAARIRDYPAEASHGLNLIDVTQPFQVDLGLPSIAVTIVEQSNRQGQRRRG